MSSNLPSESDHAGVPAEWESANGAALPYGQPLELAEDEASGGLNNLRRILAACVRFKWLIVGLAVAGAGAGFMLSRMVQPRYSVQGRIWIDEDLGPAGPIQTGQLLRSQAWLELLRSYTVLDPVVLRLRLYIEPKSAADSVVFRGFDIMPSFAPGAYRLEVRADGRQLVLSTEEGAVVERAAVGDSIGRGLGFAWVPSPDALAPGKTIAFQVRHPRDVARELNSLLRAQLPGRDPNFIILELGGTDPVRIATTLNGIMNRFVTVAAELKAAKHDTTAALLRDQLRLAEANLRQAELELESFKISTITLPTEPAMPVAAGLQETRAPAFSNFFNLKVELDQLRRDRASIIDALDRMTDSTFAVASLEYIGSVQSSAELTSALATLTSKRGELQALRVQYTDEHVLVRRVLDEIRTLERQVVPRLARVVIDQVDNRITQIERLIASASEELEQIPPRQLEEMRLTRRVSIADQLYSNLRSRYETARLAALSSVPDVRILDEAVVPHRPISDGRPRTFLLAFMGSLGLGLLGAILLDRFDPRLRYPEEITRGLRLPVLSAIPYVRRNRSGHSRSEDTVQVVEAFRQLRLSLTHAHGKAGPLITTVTSPGSGDGKSFIIANLALAFAEQGYRTILIDGDTRRGTQHRLFGISRMPGLIDYLMGEASLADIVAETAYPALHVIGSGKRVQKGPELLGSPGMRDLAQKLRSRYSVVLVDSPPLGAGVDPLVLGTVTSSLFVVLRVGATDRDFTEAKLELLDRLPIRILGAVLNAVPSQGIYRYYYPYLPGYEAGDERSDTVEATRWITASS